jgi:uncharacterized repeat protein (TIGR03803 family)
MKFARFFPVFSLVLLSGLVALPVSGAVIFTNLVSFSQTNGAFPVAALIHGVDGNFYGTTRSGGSGGSGNVFQLTAAGVLTNLASFNGTNGASPRAGLLQTADGVFYGTTYNGGSNNAGTIFRMATNGALTTLVILSFANTNGAYPIGGLVRAQDGNLYGTTAFGGTNGYGTLFRVATNGAFTLLVSFDSTNGASPYSGLVAASDGNLYGTTYEGGTNGGNGTLFKLATNGAFSSLYSFTGNADGANPYAALIQGTDGNFFGTTFSGGTNNYGTVFKFNTNGVLTTLVSFGNTNGAYPQGAVLQASDGNFYGTTSSGGAYTNQLGLGYGTVFELTTNLSLTTLVSFNGTNGGSPEAGLLQSADGSFYGTTANGGANDYGTVFRLGPAVVSAPKFQSITTAGGTLTLTWSATVGQNYQMLFKTNLAQGAWSNLNNSVTATNLIMTTPDSVGPDQQRFYRILQLP